jgi:uncharacterized RDD family membrane protein YckC
MFERTHVNRAENFSYAGFWQRAGAMIIDTMLLQSVFLLIAVGVFFITPEAKINSASKVLNILLFLLAIAYGALMECSRYQATLGKIAAGIKVAAVEGERINLGQAFGRRFAMLLSSLLLFIGFLLPIFTEKKQALHDMIAKTVVLKVGTSYFWRVMVMTLVLYVAVFASAGVYVAKNLGAWVTSGITTGAVILKEETANMPKQNSIVQEAINKNAAIKPLNISQQQYEELLATSSVNFSPSPNKPAVFPTKSIALELSTFFEGNSTQWVEVHVSPEINLGRGGYAVIQIDKVLNGKGEDVYDKASTFESEAFQTKFDSVISKVKNPIDEIRMVTVKKGTKEVDIKSVSGVIHLYLPINAQTITISGADVGKPKEIASDLQIVLQKFGNGEVGFDAIGTGANRLLKNFYAYNAKGDLLEDGGWSSSGDDSKKYLSWKVNGTPTTAEFIVVEKMLEKEYPFTLDK